MGALLVPVFPDRPRMPTEHDLPALMSRVALRDRAAFERVYRAACAHLYAVSFRILKNEQRADEVLQESFMNIWHNAGGLQRRSPRP
jgi:RNA polymerase sigma-70 factor, ECF subfamily